MSEAPAAPPRAAAKPPAHRAAPGARDGLPVPPPWWRRLRADAPFPLNLLIGGGFVAVVLLVWWALTRGTPTTAVISPSKLPGPGAVFGSFGSLWSQGLPDSLIATLQRVFLGVLLAAVFGIALGFLAGSVRAVAAAVGPLVLFLRSVPMGALLPLTLVMFRTGEQQMIMFLFLAIVAFVFSDTVKAISIVPQRYVETAQTLGATNLQIIAKVLVPLALPDIITSLRFQVGLALGYVTLVEAIGASEGIGHLLNINQTRGLIEQNYLLLFIIAGVAFGIDVLIRTVQAGVFRWRQDL